MEFSFSIDDQEFKIPDIITLSLFERLSVWDINEEQNLIPFVSVISGCPIYLLKKLAKETFELILSVCVTKIDLSRKEVKAKIGEFTLKDFDTLTFGDFVDIDIYIADGVSKHLVDITAKLYGMTESYAADLNINDVWTTILDTIEWRQTVYSEHIEFFGSDEPSDELDIKMDINKLQLMWYEAILVLAEKQFLNIQLVTSRPYKEALNFLTWKKAEVSKAKLEQLKRKNDLQKRSR